MGRLKIARNLVRMMLVLGTILIVTTCENDLQRFILEDLFGPPYRKEVAKLLPTNGSVTEDFGAAVDIDGDYAIVGAPAADNQQGAAYIFERQADGTWNTGQRIMASDGLADDSFGISVAISGNWAVVGADGKDIGVFNSAGKIYIYQRDAFGTWSETQDLDISQLNGGIIDIDDQLGSAVTIDGSWMVIGASSDDLSLGGNPYGAAYILKRSGATWNYDVRLDGVVENSRFGSAIDIYGDILVVGAHKEDTDGAGGDYNQGAAHIYRFVVDQWEISDTVTASTPTLMAHLGKGVSISTNYLVVGAYGEGIAGTASFFTRSGTDQWDGTAIQELKPADQKAGDIFGYAIATDGSYILAGAPFADYHAPLSGAVFLYEIEANGNVSLVQAVAPDDTSGLKGWGLAIAIDEGTAIIGANEDPFMGADGAAYIFE